MITFKEYLSEAQTNIVKPWKSEELKAADAIKLMNSKARGGLLAVANGGLLFRGFKKPPGSKNIITKMDASTGERTSRDTDNLYQLMMATSDSMQEYPSRGKSLICSTSYGEAENYGWVYVLVPFDETEVAVSSKHDIFAQQVSTPIYKGDLQDISADYSHFFSSVIGTDTKVFNDAALLNKSLSKFSAEELVLMFDIQNYGKDIEFVSPENKQKYDYLARVPEKFKLGANEVAMAKIKELANVMKNPKTFKAVDASAGLYNLLKKSNSSSRFTAIASTICTPKNLKLSLKTFGENLPENKECWFSGPCFAIPAYLFAEMLKQINDKNIVKLHSTAKSFLKDYEDY